MPDKELNKDLTVGLIENIVDRIIDIKYVDGRVFNVDTFQRIRNQLKMMEDVITIEMSKGVPVNGIVTMTDDVFQRYTRLDWFKNKKKEFIELNIYNRLEKITEIKWCYGADKDKNVWDSNLLATLKLKNGYIHCEDGPAFIFSDSEQYYLCNELMSYNIWVKHPLIRMSKINKIRQRYAL